MTHLGMIWIILLKNVLVLFMLDDQKVIYPCLFAFIFSSSVLFMLFNML